LVERQARIRRAKEIAAALLGFVTCAGGAHARMAMAPLPSESLFAPIPLVSAANFKESMVAASDRAKAIHALCDELAARFHGYKWKEDACGQIAWKADLKSSDGWPLLYAEFGSGPETTLLLGGVHPDELTPIAIAFRAAKHLAKNPGVLDGRAHVVIAPLVNPDGFLREKVSRANAHGIDVNRNFFTLDWYEKARKLWVDKRRSIASHFPGLFPNSEIETIFQIQLIDQYRPDKIMSIHAPLGFLDYDGPGDGPKLAGRTPNEIRAKRLATEVSEKSRHYRIVDYPFYPGSLGNYAGNERHIPTVTLEFESTNPAMLEPYWQQFLPGILQAIHYPFTTDPELGGDDGANASPFSSLYMVPPRPPRKTI
jgi:protein MpaA